MAAYPPCSERERFEVELEFVQCLANAEYVNFLAQRRYMQDADFVRYLAYLQYWRRPEYSHYITFPQCLYMLERLQQPEFRDAIQRRDVQIAVAWQQDYFFKHYRANRLREAAKEGPGVRAAPKRARMDAVAGDEEQEPVHDAAAAPGGAAVGGA